MAGPAKRADGMRDFFVAHPTIFENSPKMAMLKGCRRDKKHSEKTISQQKSRKKNTCIHAFVKTSLSDQEEFG